MADTVKARAPVSGGPRRRPGVGVGGALEAVSHPAKAVDWAIKPPKAFAGHLRSGLLSVLGVVGMVLGVARIGIALGLVEGRRLGELVALL